MKNFILRYLKSPKLYFQDRRSGVIISRSANALGCSFEGKNKIFPHAYVSGSSVGLGSYVGPHSKVHQCVIGRYCSIGPEVVVLAGRHPSDERLSTHPSFYSTIGQAGFTYVTEQNFDEFLFCDASNKTFVEIGSDVWIGARVIIMGGIKIGHGSIIASGSVVTKDVEPYSIVAGVPAKFVKYRFNEDIRKKCLEEKWWDKGEDWIMENLRTFCGDL